MSIRKVSRVFLVSTSPRRYNLLRIFNIEVIKVPQTVNEVLEVEEDATTEAIARKNANTKIEAFISGAQQIEFNNTTIVLAADTIVEIDGKPLGKPSSAAEARDMLLSLSGRWHRVITAVEIWHPFSNTRIGDVAVTEVKFSVLPNLVIDRYISTGKYRDKAGAYGIQELASVFVERIVGDYFNVVGLPLNLVQSMLYNNLALSLI